MAVASGGSLHQHLPSAGFDHHWEESRQYEPVHEVLADPGTAGRARARGHGQGELDPSPGGARTRERAARDRRGATTASSRRSKATACSACSGTRSDCSTSTRVISRRSSGWWRLMTGAIGERTQRGRHRREQGHRARHRDRARARRLGRRRQLLDERGCGQGDGRPRSPTPARAPWSSAATSPIPTTSARLAAAGSELGTLEAWVNNAGVSVLAPIVDTSVADMERMLAVNYMGTFHGVQAAAAHDDRRRTRAAASSTSRRKPRC